MTAGVPGAGIAGLFYLAGALLAPAWELLRAARRRPRSRWRGILRVAALAGGMLASMYAAGLAIGLAVATPAVLNQAADGWITSAPRSPHFIARATVLLTFGTLVAVLVGVEVLRLVVRAPRPAAPVVVSPAQGPERQV